MTIQGLSAISTSNLGDEAYDQIANAIVSGGFAPGEKLTIRHLAETLAISSTPVRDAVKRLLLEGALEQRGPREVRVPVITGATYREIAAIRLELEGLAAARAAECRNDDDLTRLQANIAENESAIAAGDWQGAMRLNKQFHFALAEIAQMPVLHGLMNGLWLRIGPPIASFYRHGGRAMIDHHYRVSQAIRDRVPDAARQAIMGDITASVDNILSHLNEQARSGDAD